MEDVILQLAQERFRLDYLFPYQRLVITNILAAARYGEEDAADYGRQIVILPTGAGKSLCFQLPAAALAGTTLVVFPLLSLMNDQARRMSEGGFTVVQLKGGQSAAERRKYLQRVRSRTLDFVITNPETLQNDAVREALRAGGLLHVVVDEAHCISEWGDSFRPLYLTLGEVLGDLAVPIVTAFTATAGDHVLKRIREVLFPESGARIIRGNPDRENISYSVIPCISRLHALRTIFRTPPTVDGTKLEHSKESCDTLPVWHPGDPLPLPAIVFCSTRADTRWYAAHLERILGPGRAFHYHAGLDKETKKDVEERFFHAADAVLCATCAYGMGVDKPNIRAVIHTYLPATAEAFLQESGRGGRDRRPALSIVLIDPREEDRYRRALNDDEVTTVQRMAFGHGCRRDMLLRAMGMDPEACAGCDRCEPGAPPIAPFPHESPAAAFLSNLVARAPHRYTLNEWVRLVRGAASWHDWFRGIPRRRGFGRLAHWQEEEIRDALEQLVDLGALRLRSDRRLTLPPTLPDADRTDHRRPCPKPRRAIR